MPEYLPITAGDLLFVVAVQVLLIALAVGGTVWVMRAPAQREPAAVPQPVECAETVDLPRPRTGGPRTGTLHGPRYQPGLADEATTVIERVRL